MKTQSFLIRYNHSTLYPQALAAEVASVARHGVITIEYAYSAGTTVVRGSSTVPALAGPLLKWFIRQYNKSAGCCAVVVRRPRVADVAKILRQSEYVEGTVA